MAVETWLRQQPAIGEQIRYADLDTATLTIAEASAKLLNIESAMVNGIEMIYYTVLQKPVAGPDMTFLYGKCGKSFTMRVGKAFKFQLEPMKIATKPDKPIDLFLYNIIRVDTALGDPEKVVRWNEVVIDGYWHPADPSWGQTTIDATRIRFSVDENEMLQIIGMVPDMKMVVLEIETADKKYKSAGIG